MARSRSIGNVYAELLQEAKKTNKLLSEAKERGGLTW
jgi:hypothetical protein